MSNRICIYPKDVQAIMGSSYSYASKIIRTIKKELGKKSHQVVTIREFAKYMGLEFEEVYAEITGTEYATPKKRKVSNDVNGPKKLSA
ncbi:hypothetical protein GSB9_00188 [Flavobacteriaceae bacterium GSB9]|nr:hypothetical protein GSB9_00188 [Flavobacteriaceae bacterium GSB9]